MCRRNTLAAFVLLAFGTGLLFSVLFSALFARVLIGSAFVILGLLLSSHR